MDLPTYTNIWRIEKRLYKLYDFRLPMPVPVGQIAVFLAIAVPYVGILALIGLPFSHTLLWLYVLPPGVLAWLTTRPVLEGKRLPELVLSQLRYLTEPRTWARMAPLTEKDEITIVARVWRRAEPVAAASPAAARARRRPARQPLAVLSRPAARPLAAGSGRPAPAQSAAARSAPARSAPARPAGTRSARFAPARPGRARPVSGQPVPGQPVPGQPVPGQPVPGQAAPGRPAPAIPAPRLAQAGVHARPDLRSRPAHAADPGAPAVPPSWPVPGVAFPAALVPPGEQFPPDLHDPRPVPASAEVPYRFQPNEPGPAGAEAAMPPGEPFQPELRARADAPLARPDAPHRFQPEPAEGDAEPPSPARPFRPGALEPEPASADAQLARPYFPYQRQPEPAEGDAEPSPPPRPFRPGTLQPEPARAEAPLARPGAAHQVQPGLVEAEPEAREPELVSAEAGPVPPGDADPASAEPDQPLVRPGQNWPVEVVEGTVTGTPGAGQPAVGAGPARRGAGWRPAAGTGGLLRGALGWTPGESRQARPDRGQPASARPRPAEPVQGQLVHGQSEPQDASPQAQPEVADQPVTQGQPAVQGRPVASWQPAAQGQPAMQGQPAAQGQPAVESDEVQVVPGPAMSPPVVVPSSVQRPDTPAVPDTRGPAGLPPAIPPPTARPAADAGPAGVPARPRELSPATGRPDDPATGRPDDAAARLDPAMPAAQTAPAAAAPAASAPATSAPAAGDTWNEEAPATGRPERDESRPVVTVTGAAAERPMRVVERALRSQQGRRGDGWRDRVVMVPGGHRPGKPDQLQRDRARARLPLREPQRIVVLGCTRGAGQTTTVLLAGDMLAGLRGEPVAVLDLNPGRGSLAEQAAAIPGLVAEPQDSPRLVGAPNPAGGPALDAGLQVISGGPVPSGGDAGRIIDSVAARYTLTLADPAAGCVPRSLEVADQLMIVAPASAEAANALGMTFEWLEAHGHGRLATGAVTVLNGVSGPTAGHAERAANVATGRCRAIVKVPWDSHLKDIARDRAPYHGPDTGSAQAPAVLAAPTDADAGYQPPGPRSASLLSPALTHAYTALAGVLIAGLADPGELRSAR